MSQVFHEPWRGAIAATVHLRRRASIHTWSSWAWTPRAAKMRWDIGPRLKAILTMRIMLGIVHRKTAHVELFGHVEICA